MKKSLRMKEEEDDYMLRIAKLESIQLLQKETNTCFNIFDYAEEIDEDAWLKKAKAESLASYSSRVLSNATKQFDRAEYYINYQQNAESLEESQELLCNRISKRSNVSIWLQVCSSLESSEKQLVDEAMVLIGITVLIYLDPFQTQDEMMTKKEFKAITNSILSIMYPQDAELKKEYEEIQNYIRQSIDDVQMEAKSDREIVAYHNDLWTAYNMSRLPISPKSPLAKQSSIRFTPYLAS